MSSPEPVPDLPPARQRWFHREPPWWIRDILIAFTLSVVLLAAQWFLDDQRSERESEANAELAQLAERQENLRFVRERSVASSERPFSGIDLEHQNLAGLNLSKANLRGASLGNSDLTGTDLEGSDLEEANLNGAQLAGAKLKNARISCVGPEPSKQHCVTYMRRTILVNADLEGADLTGVDLSSSWFTDGTNLDHTILRNAEFYGAILYSADFRNADLSGASFDGACYVDKNGSTGTQWPPGFVPPPSRSDCIYP